MSVNFLDITGVFQGMDIHLWFPQPPPPVPALPPVPLMHAVGANRVVPLCRFWRVVPTVTTETRPVVQSGFATLLVPHIPLVPTGHAVLEPPAIALCIATSSSSPVMSVNSVTASGQPLATALAGFLGMNMDCGLQPMPSAIDINLNSVKTSPSLGDYCAAAVGVWLNGMMNVVTGGMNIPGNAAPLLLAAIANLNDVANQVVDLPIPDPLSITTWVIGKVCSLVQSKVDG